MMISCEKATIICNKAQYQEASKWDLITLKVHKFLCKTCSHYTNKNTELTSLCKKAKLAMLSEKEKSKMRETLAAKNQK